MCVCVVHTVLTMVHDSGRAAFALEKLSNPGVLSAETIQHLRDGQLGVRCLKVSDCWCLFVPSLVVQTVWLSAV